MHSRFPRFPGTGGSGKIPAFRILWGAALLWFSSCSRIPGQLLIMEANFFSSHGLYTEAASSYLKAREYAGAAAYAEYGLGSVYFSVDEGAAALERFSAAQKALDGLDWKEHAELIYRLRYNTGIIHFEAGDYTAAAAAFREALETDGSRLEAKRNLELSLLALARKTSSPAAYSPGPGSGEQEQMETIFDYIRRKEREQWKGRTWIEEDTPQGPDY